MAPSLKIITPVGPGHEIYAKECAQSVKNEIERAIRVKQFSSIKHQIVDDTEGKLGRSAARNIAMCDSDWYFFIDADDVMMTGALDRNDFDAPATFGALRKLNGEYSFNVYPCGWNDVAQYGCYGTLSMGFFCRPGPRFNEDMDGAEDFEFYMRLPSFTKVAEPLVAIGYNRPSATGPRGYHRFDWIKACDAQVVAAVEKDPKKYDLDSGTLLAKKVDPRKHTRKL